jgi:hypothetical protein
VQDVILIVPGNIVVNHSIENQISVGTSGYTPTNVLTNAMYKIATRVSFREVR